MSKDILGYIRSYWACQGCSPLVGASEAEPPAACPVLASQHPSSRGAGEIENTSRETCRNGSQKLKHMAYKERGRRYGAYLVWWKGCHGVMQKQLQLSERYSSYGGDGKFWFVCFFWFVWGLLFLFFPVPMIHKGEWSTNCILEYLLWTLGKKNSPKGCMAGKTAQESCSISTLWDL